MSNSSRENNISTKLKNQKPQIGKKENASKVIYIKRGFISFYMCISERKVFLMSNSLNLFVFKFSNRKFKIL